MNVHRSVINDPQAEFASVKPQLHTSIQEMPGVHFDGYSVPDEIAS
jgi:hypothetical protein